MSSFAPNGGGAPISTGLLEDFLENIEHLPLELQAKFTILNERETLFDDLKKHLHKHRNMLLRSYNQRSKAQSSNSNNGPETQSQENTTTGHDDNTEAVRHELAAKIEREYQRAISALEDKMSIEREMTQAIEQYIRALEHELSKVEPVQSVLPPRDQ
jgi:hypothetical protein